ncbi:MAG: YwqG family protein [Myxococcota bacterium]|nr:YwqG family protein [Myxococcota bacterium]
MRLDLPAELEPIRERIEGAAAPCVVLHPAPGASDDGEITRTRLGGSPLLPLGTRWPRSDRGPLSFVGQLDFRELSAAIGPGARAEFGLPADGVLSFFYDVEDQPWGYDPAHASGFALVYAPDAERTVDVEPPDGTIPFDVEPLRASSALSLPWLGDRAMSSWDEALDERAYRHFVERFALTQGEGIPALRQQVGGHAQWLRRDGRITAELASSGVHAGGDPRTWRSADLRRAESEAESWRLLWQLKPEDDRFTWVDLGTLYVLIRDEDLRARRFERGWVVFQSG